MAEFSECQRVTDSCVLQGRLLCKLSHKTGGQSVINSLSFHPTTSTLLSACHSQLYLWRLAAT